LQQATQHGTDAQRVQQAGPGAERRHAEGIAEAEHQTLAASVSRHRLEDRLPCGEVDEIPHRHVLLGETRALIAVLDDSPDGRRRVRQRTQEHCLHDREHRDVGADAERQRQQAAIVKPGLATSRRSAWRA
jgi:hypothetical protein